ncbi:MAG TPA: hypothetical protein VE441_04665 [Mycobacterium sp.]|jgi:hypothetical protein|nr:hypothetical protein [Mycobacterium sp.]
MSPDRAKLQPGQELSMFSGVPIEGEADYQLLKHRAQEFLAASH